MENKLGIENVIIVKVIQCDGVSAYIDVMMVQNIRVGAVFTK